MFNPAYIYLFVHAEQNGEMIPSIDPAIFAAIFICSCNACFVGIFISLLWILCGYLSILGQYSWLTFWRMLTPGNEWIEISTLLLCIIVGGIELYIIRGINNLVNELIDKKIKEEEPKEEKTLICQ